MNSLVQLNVSLERRLIELTETLEKVRRDFLDKSAEVELLQKKVDDQVGRWRVEGMCTV